MSLNRRDYDDLAAVMARVHKGSVIRGHRDGQLAVERTALSMAAHYSQFPAFDQERFLTRAVAHSDGHVLDADYVRRLTEWTARGDRHVPARRDAGAGCTVPAGRALRDTRNG